MSEPACAEPTFTHHDPGTPESRWMLDPAWDDVPTLDLQRLFTGVQRLVVLSAHPDDETLGASLLMQAAHRAGIEITLVVATSGEASHPQSRTWTPELLVSTRRDELAAAVERLAPGIHTIHLGLPDSGLASHTDELVDRLLDLVDAATLVVAPWTHDGHIDHDTLGAAATTVAGRARASLLHYPVWLWHWGTPADLPWERAVTLEGNPHSLRVKHAALAEHRSQVEPLGPLPGDEPVVGPDVTLRAHRLVETFFAADASAVTAVAAHRTPQDAAPFDSMYADGDDPWGFAASFYESRKRALLLAVLRRDSYDAALEIGCADGLLTVDLAGRCTSITSLDVSEEAIRRARARGLENARFVVGAAPDAVPADPVDLVVLSEVGYFLTPTDWYATLRRCRSALRPGGEIVLVHWQHPTSDIPLDGPLVQEAATSVLGLPRTASYSDADVAIDVYGGPVSPAGVEVPPEGS